MAANATFRSIGDIGFVPMTDSCLLYSYNSTAEVFLKQTDRSKCLGDKAAAVCDAFKVTHIQGGKKGYGNDPVAERGAESGCVRRQ